MNERPSRPCKACGAPLIWSEKTLKYHCTPCNRVRMARWIASLKEKGLSRPKQDRREYNKLYRERLQHDPEFIAKQKQWRADSWRKYKNDPEKVARSAAIQRERVKDPLLRPRLNAQQAVYRAIKRGQLVRLPCEACGDTKKTDAHHDDYSKPLDIRWLCRSCHLRHHALTENMK